MDSDDSLNPDDHGLNMDSAPASNDNPSTNFDSLSTNYEDPGILSRPSTSQTSVIQSKGHLLCDNYITRMRSHLLEIAEVRNVIQQWVRQQQVQVSSDSVVCHSTAAWTQIRQPTGEQQNVQIIGHGQVCISCGRLLLRIRSHTLRSDSPHEELKKSVIARQIAPRALPSSSCLCHNCWRRTDRAASRSTTEWESEPSSLPMVQSEPSNLPSVQSEVTGSPSQAGQQSLNTSDSILLPNYVRAPNIQNQCFFPGCNKTNRLALPSALRVHLFCEYNYYVPPDCIYI